MAKHPDADPPAVERRKRRAEGDDLGVSPSRIENRRVRREVERAAIWCLVVGLAALAVLISHSLLVIFGAMVFAAIIDGGARLLGKALPVRRGVRIALVCLAAIAFLVWLVRFAGTRISREAAALPQILQQQAGRLAGWADAQGFVIDLTQVQGYAGQIMSGLGMLTTLLGGFIGAATTAFLIAVIGIYVAAEPRLYERGAAWLVPHGRRADLHVTLDRMAFTMRRLMAGRLLGMAVEGLFTYALLAWYGVPLAALLGILTGLLAFIPNVGAVVSGLLMVAVGFSGGLEMGLYTVFVYVLVQTLDGYVLIPLIARKTVDLAPALVLAAQFVMGVLFGLIGVLLADPLLAMLKVALERRVELAPARGGVAPAGAAG